MLSRISIIPTDILYTRTYDTRGDTKDNCLFMNLQSIGHALSDSRFLYLNNCTGMTTYNNEYVCSISCI